MAIDPERLGWGKTQTSTHIQLGHWTFIHIFKCTVPRGSLIRHWIVITQMPYIIFLAIIVVPWGPGGPMGVIGPMGPTRPMGHGAHGFCSVHLWPPWPNQHTVRTFEFRKTKNIRVAWSSQLNRSYTPTSILHPIRSPQRPYLEKYF